jgi:adenylyltransferase/sulfurtransferase
MEDAAAVSRYHRQMLLPGIGAEGQARLRSSHALIVGCGALGCASADLLCRAGVGTLTIVDRDVVEVTNLQRQTLFDERDSAEGTPKAEAARRRLSAINLGVRVRGVVADVTHKNIERLVSDAAGLTKDAVASPVSILIDGTDNFETRYLINDLSVKLGVPYCYGGAVGTRGMQAMFVPGATGCLRCVFPEPPGTGVSETCDTAGVLGPGVAMVGAMQASAAIEFLVRGTVRGETPSASILTDFDLWGGTLRTLNLGGKAEACPCCGSRRFEFLEGRFASRTIRLCGQNAVQIAPAGDSGVVELDLARLGARLMPHALGSVVVNDFLVRATLANSGNDGEGDGTPGEIELTVFGDGRAVVKGTEQPSVARGVYARYVGA